MSTSASLSSWTSWSPAGVSDAVWSSYTGAVANGTAVPEAAYRAVVASVPQPQLLVALAFGLHTLFYIMTVIPAIIFPLIPFMRRYKIQKHRTVTWGDIVQCLGLVAINQIFVEIPLYCAIPLYTHYTGMPYTWESLPDWRHLLWQIPFSLMAEDAYHYWAHRLLHHPALYGRIHKIHHTYNSPFTMVAEYAHPIETMVLGTGFFVPILVLTPMIHVSFLFVWLAVRILETADVHSGYDIPWNPLRLIPFYGGATAHDLHHAKSNGNYSSTFTWWDTWCGTTLAASNYKEYSGKALTSSTVKAVRVDEKSE